jgi:rhamnulokinase
MEGSLLDKMPNYVAVDIGASSGRVMLSSLTGGKIALEEIHRFPNGFSKIDGKLRWNIDGLIEEILIGLEKVRASGVMECSVGIDTWGVDYVLVDESGLRIADPISYRDERTTGKIEEFAKRMPKKELYRKTGIQFLSMNTLYQLLSESDSSLKRADKILMIPDYINYILTGAMRTEKTNASTTQMLNTASGDFDDEILGLLGIGREKFAPFISAGKIIGEIKKEYYAKHNLPKVKIVSVASHDTASAVAGVPAETENFAFISSGTWSLLGAECRARIVSDAAFEGNWTNELGVFGTYRFLKNIIGLWVIQEIAKAYDGKYSFAEIAKLANEFEYIKYTIDICDDRFAKPANMGNEIKAALEEKYGESFENASVGKIANVVYSSLALTYKRYIADLGKLTGKNFDSLYIVGGGSNVASLNELTARQTGLKVFAGPSEASAIGNIAVQMVASGEAKDIGMARGLIKKSFEIKEYNGLQYKERRKK